MRKAVLLFGYQLDVGQKIGFLKRGKSTGVTMVKKPDF